MGQATPKEYDLPAGTFATPFGRQAAQSPLDQMRSDPETTFTLTGCLAKSQLQSVLDVLASCTVKATFEPAATDPDFAARLTVVVDAEHVTGCALDGEAVEEAGLDEGAGLDEADVVWEADLDGVAGVEAAEEPEGVGVGPQAVSVHDGFTGIEL